VYKCSEGWEPLCKFLGCQIPDESFPHKNKNSSIVSKTAMQKDPGFRKIQREITMSVCAVMCGVGYIAYRIVQGSFLLV